MAASAVCPFPPLEFPFRYSGGTHAHRTSIDPQFLVTMGSIAPKKWAVNLYFVKITDYALPFL
jgi:hypothetical protein